MEETRAGLLGVPGKTPILLSLELGTLAGEL